MPEKSIVLKLSGIIDSENSEIVKKELLDALADSDADAVILDAGELSGISGAGMRMLLQIRDAFPRLSIVNVRPEVYEILETTGFTEMVTVDKAFRSISVEGCAVIGEGANGKVYRIDRETVVKTYKNTDALPEIQNEQRCARLAFILGIPTAISYDVVRVGDCYGAVFELLNAHSFSEILAEQPEKMDWCVQEYVSMLRRIHSTAVPEGKLPSINRTAQGWVSRMKSCLPPGQGQKLQEMVDAVPERGTMVHGDYHTRNIVLSGEEVMLIDMDTLSTGHPIFELAQMYCSFIGFHECFPLETKRFLGFDADLARVFWRKSLQAYLDTDDELTVTEEENRIRCVAYARLLDWSMRHHPSDDAESIVEREHWKRELTALLTLTDTLIPVKNKKAEEPEKVLIRTGEEASIGETILNSESVRKTDLHMYTTISDGTDTPEELLSYVRKAGIPVFSITDHDSGSGFHMIRDSLREDDPHLIAGAEFSCRDEEGQYHILGYGFDPDAYSVQKLMEIGYSGRIRKADALRAHLKDDLKISIPDEVFKKLYVMDRPGRLHFRNLMSKYGDILKKDPVVGRFFNRIHFISEHLRPEEAVTGILAAGGIPVLAHPVPGSGEQQITGEALERRLKILMGYGLKGVEVFYPECSPEQRRELLAFAETHGLYVTAGSGYRGKNNRAVPGITGMYPAADLPDGFRRFLKDVCYLH